MKLLLIVILCFGTSQAKQGFGPGEQDWNYEEVRPGAHMFWWLYYTTANVSKFENKPLIIWIEGGPGESGTGYGNFMQFGPLDINLKPRNYTWVQYYNVLFIDNPVGTGFSYVENDTQLSTNNSQIAADLVQCLRGFYNKLPQFIDTPLYIIGESYGGKMLIEFARDLYKKTKEGTVKSNLIGTVLIDSLISPTDTFLNYANYLFSTSLVDLDGYEIIKEYGEKIKYYTDKGDYSTAFDERNKQLQAVKQLTHNVDVYNIETPVDDNFTNDKIHRILPQDESDDLYNLMNKQVKQALNISDNIEWRDLETNGCFEALYDDIMRPVTDIVEEVLNTTTIKVYVLNGQLDLIISTPGTYAWVTKLNYKDKEEWNQAPRNALVHNNFIEGYSKSYNNFAFYWVVRSGHTVAKDNPAAMEQILQDLIK